MLAFLFARYYRLFPSILLLGLALTHQVHATTTTFDDEAVFLAAAGNLPFESFETLPPSGPTKDPIDTPSFVVSLVGDEQSDMAIVEVGPEGEGPTDGDKFLVAGNTTEGGALALTFSLFTSVNAFGLNILDFGDNGEAGKLYIETDAGHMSPIATSLGAGTFGNNNLLFFGLIDDVVSFSTVTLVKTTTGDGIFVDEVYFTPEPSTGVLVSLGVLGLGAYRKRRRGALDN